jgi:uncharacterized protein with FMN-binding domain
MRRVIVAFVSTVAGLVMLLSFKTHSRPRAVALPAADDGTVGTTAPTTSTAPSDPGDPTATTTPTTPTTASPTTAAGGAQSVTGDEADTRYGPVQVKVTVDNGHITAVDAVEYPTDTPRDWQINQYAIPVLDQEAQSANSAHIDMVSGATYTSDGYITSLQSALDKLGLS